MARSKFMDALDNLVRSTEKSMRRNPRRRPARRNMAVRMLPDGTIEADTPEELRAFMAGAPAPAKKKKKKKKKRKERRPRAERAAPSASAFGSAFGVEPEPEEAPAPTTTTKKKKRGASLRRNDFLRIGKSVGGFSTLCPGQEAEPYRTEGMTAIEGALRAAGLDDDTAALAAFRMERAGVLQKTTTSLGNEKRAKAREILLSVAGMSCPLPPSAKSNPGYMIPLQYPISDFEYGRDHDMANWTSYPEYSYSQFSRSNPRRLVPSPFIGIEREYMQPTNAGPYLPQTFPYGQGGRPATYAVPNRGRYQDVLDEYGPAGFVFPDEAPHVGSFPINTIERARYALAIVGGPAFDDKPRKRQEVYDDVIEAYRGTPYEQSLRDQVATVKATVRERMGKATRSTSRRKRRRSRKRR